MEPSKLLGQDWDPYQWETIFHFGQGMKVSTEEVIIKQISRLEPTKC